MKLYIKNMVCSRCIMAVRSEMEKLGLQPLSVELGEVEIEERQLGELKDILRSNLQALGFDLIDNQRSKLIETIKNTIIDLVHHQDHAIRYNLSEVLSQKLNYDYNYLSSLFSEIEGTTIEKYHIAQKIEKVKELLVYDELSLSEIADRLHYSSVAYLSNQFKKVTGLTPTHFKHIGQHKRKALDEV